MSTITTTQSLSTRLTTLLQRPIPLWSLLCGIISGALTIQSYYTYINKRKQLFLQLDYHNGLYITQQLFIKHWFNIDIDNEYKLNKNEVIIVMQNILNELSNTDNNNNDYVQSYVSAISSHIDSSYTQQQYIKNILKSYFTTLNKQAQQIIDYLLIHIENSIHNTNNSTTASNSNYNKHNTTTDDNQHTTPIKRSIVVRSPVQQSVNTNTHQHITAANSSNNIVAPKVGDITYSDMSILFCVWLESRIISHITVQLL